MGVVVALRRDSILSPNYSSRGGTRVRLVVLHTAEGARTYQDLGAFFANPASGVSSHVGIDDTPGVVGEYVRPDYKAWTQANANPYSVAAELCAFASWSPSEWQNHGAMLENTAAWIAEECARFAVPLERLTPSQAQGGRAGVCQHVDLGTAGGNHWDCGPSFPMDDVMEMAAGGRPNVGPSPTKRKGRTMIASTDGDGYWTTTSDGAVYAFGDAQFRGSSFDTDPMTPGNQVVKVTGEIVGIAGHGKSGYWLLASDGGIFTFGDADFHGRPDRV
jgi:hypothetical protein